jgi:hypothetical protein
MWKERERGEWIQDCGVSGAVRGVKGISWDEMGRYLLSVRYPLSSAASVMVVWIRRRGCLGNGNVMEKFLGMKLLGLKSMDMT